MRRWLAWLISAEVRRLTAELDEVRQTRARAVRSAGHWHATALLERARADALAKTREKSE